MTRVSGLDLLLPLGSRSDGAFQAEPPVATPAAGVSGTYTVTGDFYEVIQTLNFIVTTSAAVGNRIVQLAVVDANGAVVFSISAAATQPPGVLGRYLFAPGINTNSVNAIQYFNAIEIPLLVLVPGWALSFGPLIEDAADTITNISLLVHRYSTEMVTEPQSPPLVPTPLLV